MADREGVGPPVLEARALSKSYGTNRVLSGVDVRVGRGELVAVIGENGAGKSTFVRILAGATRPDSGSVLVDGRPVVLNAPRDAIREGIAFIPQELAYVPELTVAENILIGQWPGRLGTTSQRQIVRRAREVVDRFGLEVDVRRRMDSLKLADRQLVEILKALSRQARAILLDEPTASLTDAESGLLFRVLRQLAGTGVGVLYISHRMDEVFRFSDRVDVLRNGELVASAPTGEATPDQLIAAMLGQAAERFEAAVGPELGAPALTLSGWTGEGLADVGLAVRAGETVGLFGIRGSGADTIAEGLAGRLPGLSGRVEVGGREQRVFRSPREAWRSGVAYLPAERKRDGLLLGFPIRRNLTLLVTKAISRAGVVLGGREERIAAALVSRFDVRCRGTAQPVGQLSGGNQQKVLLASRLAPEPRVVVLHEPTRGVDVGARLEIHRFLRETAARGAAILLVTSDIEEAVAVSDRLLVVRDGVVRGELAGDRKTQGRALRIATGTDG